MKTLNKNMFSFTFYARLISVIDVVGPMNPYQPIPFHILSFDVFQSRILIYASSNIYISYISNGRVHKSDEIAEEEKFRID